MANPHLVLWGDYIDKSLHWQRIRADTDKYAVALKAAGGTMDVVDLPALGICGNSHMMMMDKNSDLVAQLIQKWMTKHGLMKKL